MNFLFTLAEIRAALEGESPADRELYVQAEVYDWFWMQKQIGWAIAVVHSNITEVKLLGDASRTFRPNQTMNVYVRIIKYNPNRNIYNIATFPCPMDYKKNISSRCTHLFNLGIEKENDQSFKVSRQILLPWLLVILIDGLIYSK